MRPRRWVAGVRGNGRTDLCGLADRLLEGEHEMPTITYAQLIDPQNLALMDVQTQEDSCSASGDHDTAFAQ